MTLMKVPEPGYFLSGPNPPLPDVPHAEWVSRLTKARGLMAEAAIDLLVLTSETNCRYFGAFHSFHWITPSLQPLVILLPVEGEPVAVCGAMFVTTVEAQSWVRDIRYQESAHEIEAQRRLWAELAETVQDMGHAKSAIGLEMGDLGHTYISRPYNDIRTFMEGLPEAKFVPGDRTIWGCRMIKSPLEIERMKRAAAIHRTATGAVVAGFRPGMTERDVGKIYMRACIDNDADLALSGHIACGATKEGMLDTLAQFDGITIGRDDYLWLDIVTRYKGYWADMARVLNVGPSTQWFKDTNELMWQAFDNATRAAKPGARAKDIWNAVAEVEQAAGLQAVETAGHGLGLDIHEPPVLSSGNETVLVPGMTLAVEPGTLSSWRKQGGDGVVHYEELIIITDDGCEVVPGLTRGITQVAHPFQ